MRRDITSPTVPKNNIKHSANQYLCHNFVTMEFNDDMFNANDKVVEHDDDKTCINKKTRTVNSYSMLECLKYIDITTRQEATKPNRTIYEKLRTSQQKV